MTRIALVEDNADNRLLVQAILEGLYEIEEYESGAEALVGLQARPPALVLLDISLPAMDGTEVLRRLRADGRTQGIPVIALTAHAMSGDRERFLEMGFDAYVTKPIIDESVLLAEIERLLNPG
ncbi:MAG: response regulator [Gemmatimonadetes bacterium]|nr:response regulator [Gemmatimonadota bacterium]